MKAVGTFEPDTSYTQSKQASGGRKSAGVRIRQTKPVGLRRPMLA